MSVEPNAPAVAALRERLERGQKELEMTRSLKPHQKRTLDVLKDLHMSHMLLEKEYRDEWTALKLKYFTKLRPLYDKRQQELKKNAVPPADGAIAAGGNLALPDFWLTALKNHSTISQTIEDHDEPILRYLENIDYQWHDENEQTSFSISMTFAENPFFTNTVLVKEFELEEDPETYESVLSKSIGTAIDWKPGKNVTKKSCSRRQRNKRTGETRIVKDVADHESFFHFFDSHEIPNDEKLESMREHDIQELENVLEVEYEIGCILRDKIITHALGWYLGIEIDEDEDSEDEEEEDDEDSDDAPSNSEEEDVESEVERKDLDRP